MRALRDDSHLARAGLAPRNSPGETSTTAFLANPKRISARRLASSGRDRRLEQTNESPFLHIT